MSKIKATALSNLAGTLEVPVDTVVQGSAKAWVNFNGVGTVAINAAFNVSSITDIGLGDYAVNFASALSSVHYTQGYALSRGAATGANILGIEYDLPSKTTTYFRFILRYVDPTSIGAADITQATLAFHV